MGSKSGVSWVLLRLRKLRSATRQLRIGVGFRCRSAR